VTTSPESIVSNAQRQKYVDDGFFVLERVIPHDHLQMLRDEAANFVAKVHAEMDAKGVNELGTDIRDNRYFIANRYKESQRLHEFLFSELMAQICRATIGPDALLFYEQFVLKGAEKGVHFSWHQDSGYVAAKHKPYVSCWCALDDMTEENGTVYMLPYARAGTRERIEHVRVGRDMVGYHGDDPGDPVICPAGSIAVFSSVCFHRSGANLSPRMRRVYLAQYSPDPILNKKGEIAGFAEPLLRNGERVAGASR
jgi:ectoine hydroxylase-related dioxygenase (phytanoyl-CoA dioxygenase family)